MPINFAKDTKAALGEFAGACENRSLLQQRFVFFEKDLDAARRLALDLWVDGGREDVQRLTDTASAETRRLERKLAGGNLRPDQRARTERDRAESYSYESLCKRLLVGMPRWQSRGADRCWLPSKSESHRSFSLSTRQRLAIGLANGVPENTGLTLHRRFGYSLIPGSALKGLALRGAIDVQADETLRRVVLGGEPDDEKKTPARAGAVGFLDAVAEDATVELDIVTPHYGNYYSESTRDPNPDALDTEQPKPNVFPVVAAGARFRFDLVLIRGRDLGRFAAVEVLGAAQKWLTHALTLFGAGAKTRSGYGRFGESTPVGTAMTLFPDVADLAAPAAADGPQKPVKTPAENCVAKWHNRVPTFGDPIKLLVADLAVLNDADLRDVARRLINPTFWDDATGTPANPTRNPFWKDFAKALGGTEVLARLSKNPA